MPIQSTCPSCKTQYNLANTMLGKKVQCKQCFDTFVVLVPGKKTYTSIGIDALSVPVKEISSKLFYAMGHRIECDNCQTPFVYIDGGTAGNSMTGIVGTNDADILQGAFQVAFTDIPLGDVGSGLCPHCHCYQGFMMKAKRAISPGIVLSMIILSVFTLGISLLAILLLKYINKKTFTRGPHPDMGDPHSMTDEEFAAFFAKAGQGTMDPFLAWWIQCGNQPYSNETPLSLGLSDSTGMPGFPEVASTESIIQNYLR